MDGFRFHIPFPLANIRIIFIPTKFYREKLKKNESQAFLLAAQMTSCVPCTCPLARSPTLT